MSFRFFFGTIKMLQKWIIVDIYVCSSAIFFRNCCFCCCCVVSNTNFTTTCDESGSLCKCTDHISFTEPPYEENSTVNMWCGKSPLVFRSKGRVLAINYLHQTGHINPFNLTYIAKRTSKLVEMNFCFPPKS